MRASEKKETIARIVNKVKKRGIPINVRTGGNEDLAEWEEKLLEELLEEDEPLGTVQMHDFYACPKCHGIVGDSGYYCRFCGSLIRWHPEGR